MLNFQIEPTHAAASQVHRRVRESFDRFEAPASLAADVELVVAELAANAVDHGPNHPIELEVQLLDYAVHVTVSNHSVVWRKDLLPNDLDLDPLTDRGRGLAIVHALVDGMWVHGPTDSTSITCLFKRDRWFGSRTS